MFAVEIVFGQFNWKKSVSVCFCSKRSCMNRFVRRTSLRSVQFVCMHLAFLHFLLSRGKIYHTYFCA